MPTVWVVDDDQEMAHAIQLMLKLIRFEPQGFLSAQAAAEALLSGKSPDLVLLDISMPEVSGLDLLEFIRRRQEWSHVPVVMLSTEAADVTVDRALALGADGYITKPVTLEELESALNQAIEKHGKGQS
jgi:DNA-binding response OmpR family regulator